MIDYEMTRKESMRGVVIIGLHEKGLVMINHEGQNGKESLLRRNKAVGIGRHDACLRAEAYPSPMSLN